MGFQLQTEHVTIQAGLERMKQVQFDLPVFSEEVFF